MAGAGFRGGGGAGLAVAVRAGAGGGGGGARRGVAVGWGAGAVRSGIVEVAVGGVEAEAEGGDRGNAGGPRARGTPWRCSARWGVCTVCFGRPGWTRGSAAR